MTVITTQAGVLTVLRMTETDAKSRSHLRCAGVTPKFMTNAARGNLLLSGLRLRTVTLEAGHMRIESGRDAHCDAATTGTMTTSATNAAHARVTRMIEFHVEAIESRKWLQSS